jgi:hypothetical protein
VPRTVTRAAEIRQLTIAYLQSFHSLMFWRVACMPQVVASTEVRQKGTFMEEQMKTFSDVAASYEEWAETNEATAEEILAGLDSCAVNIRENQRRHASQLSAEAVEFRDRAADFRNLERRLSSLGLTASVKSAEN